jgi:cyclopropane fatty-acyl-phospholipid synthase-like methyltransferase
MSAPEDYRTRIYARYASNFQDTGTTFDVHAAWHWGKAYRYYLRNWLPANKESIILDVACGGGKLLYFYQRMGFKHISGVDISSEQVQLARQVTPAVTEASVLNFLESKSDTYDLISGLDIIEHFYKPEVLNFLDLCVRSLKTGGRLVLQVPNAESPWGASLRYGDFTHELGFTPNSLIGLLTLSGFTNIKVREVGPVPFGHSFLSTLRHLIWQTIRAVLKGWNLAETGNSGCTIITRVFLISGVKP